MLADTITPVNIYLNQYIIAINHFKNELYIFEHQYVSDDQNLEDSTNLIESLIQNKNFPAYKFNTINKEETNFTDSEFLEVLAAAKQHNHRGDVFQIVISRSFSQQFQGDEFNVYRSLRSINQSPYLFYITVHLKFLALHQKPKLLLKIKRLLSIL